MGIAVVGALAGALLALVAAWFSSPPTVQVLGISVATPSDVIFKFTSTFRVYTRFVELIELGLCIPFAYAVARMQHGRRPVTNLAIVAALGVVLVLDLWSRPAVRTVSVTPPPQYVWLRDHPGGIVADYPLELAAFPDYSALFWQMEHRHPLFQGYDSGSEAESMKVDMSDIAEPGTAAKLADLGVKYIVVHPGQAGADENTVVSQHYIVRFASAAGSVWQVAAAPARTRVDDLVNFSTLEGNPGSEYRWMVDSPGILGAYARDCASCRGEVTFESSSNSVSRTITIRDQRSGRTLAQAEVPAGRAVRVKVPGVTLHNGRARLVVSTNIPAEVPASGGDPRRLSVTVGEPRLSLSGA